MKRSASRTPAQAVTQAFTRNVSRNVSRSLSHNARRLASPLAAWPPLGSGAAWSHWWSAALQWQQIAMQAPWVIWSRTSLLSDPHRAGTARGQREARRMVSEKHDAALQAWAAMGRAWMAPGLANPSLRAARATQAALKPVRQRVSANAKRLAGAR
ncbi:MAG: hypothetical protein RL669_1814 [Pseudomonadota bacterium]